MMPLTVSPLFVMIYPGFGLVCAITPVAKNNNKRRVSVHRPLVSDDCPKRLVFFIILLVFEKYYSNFGFTAFSAVHIHKAKVRKKQLYQQIYG
jgi:hypothetical protein